MREDLATEPRFDFGVFSRQAANAPSGAPQSEDGQWWIDGEYDVLRKDGIRVALETADREDDRQFRGRFIETLGPEFDFDLARLFEGSEDEEPLGEDMDLARFWLFTVPGIGFFDLEQTPFDLAYFLREQLLLRSAEPDIPFTAYNPGGLIPPTQIIGTKALDRAWSLRAMNVPDAWSYSDTNGKKSKGEGILIGHPDTGYADHLDLDASRLQKSLGYDFVDNKPDPEDPLNYRGSPGHGTATGSVIMSGGTVTPPPTSGEGGTGPPGKVTGVAPNVDLVPIRTARTVVWIGSSDIARAIFRARRQGCHVVSISMGGNGFRALKLALHDAVKKSLIVVAAAGNHVRTVVYPARYSDCIALAATNIHSAPWNGTCRGKAVDVSAPGEQVWRAYRGRHNQGTTDVGPSNGTSYATANSAGVAALWLAHHDRQKLISGATQLTLQEIFRDAVKNTARTPQGWNSRLYGSGIIDALALLKTSMAAGPSAHAAGGGVDTGLDQALDFLAPLKRDEAVQILCGVLGVDDDDLAARFDEWEHELLSILFKLDMEENLRFDEIRLLKPMPTEDRGDGLRALVRERASTTLKTFMDEG